MASICHSCNDSRGTGTSGPSPGRDRHPARSHSGVHRRRRIEQSACTGAMLQPERGDRCCRHRCRLGCGLLRPRRPDPSGDRRPASPGRGDRGRARRAVRPDTPGHPPSRRRPPALRADPPTGRRSAATVQGWTSSACGSSAVGSSSSRSVELAPRPAGGAPGVGAPGAGPMTASARLDGDELMTTRHLDAEPELVWEAFTTREQVAAFWGGHHATVPPGCRVRRRHAWCESAVRSAATGASPFCRGVLCGSSCRGSTDRYRRMPSPIGTSGASQSSQ